MGVMGAEPLPLTCLSTLAACDANVLVCADANVPTSGQSHGEGYRHAAFPRLRGQQGMHAPTLAFTLVVCYLLWVAASMSHDPL